MAINNVARKHYSDAVEYLRIADDASDAPRRLPALEWASLQWNWPNSLSLIMRW